MNNYCITGTIVSVQRLDKSSVIEINSAGRKIRQFVYENNALKKGMVVSVNGHIDATIDGDILLIVDDIATLEMDI